MNLLLENSDIEFENDSIVDETQVHDLIERIDLQQSSTESLDAEEEQRSIYCSSRCKKCVSCTCKNHGLPCINEKCMCNWSQCNNKEKRDTFYSWKKTSDCFQEISFDENEMKGKIEKEFNDEYESFTLLLKSQQYWHIYCMIQ